MMADAKSTASGDKVASEKGPEDYEKGADFDGEVRFDGSVLVDREIDGEVVTVMTDKPRKGDKIQAHELNDETGKLEPASDKGERITPPKR
jgi:hypothetical protein